MAIDINIMNWAHWMNFWHWVPDFKHSTFAHFQGEAFTVAFVSALFDYLVVRSSCTDNGQDPSMDQENIVQPLVVAMAEDWGTPNWRFPVFHHETWLFFGMILKYT